MSLIFSLLKSHSLHKLSIRFLLKRLLFIQHCFPFFQQLSYWLNLNTTASLSSSFIFRLNSFNCLILYCKCIVINLKSARVIIIQMEVLINFQPCILVQLSCHLSFFHPIISSQALIRLNQFIDPSQFLTFSLPDPILICCLWNTDDITCQVHTSFHFKKFWMIQGLPSHCFTLFFITKS